MRAAGGGPKQCRNQDFATLYKTKYASGLLHKNIWRPKREHGAMFLGFPSLSTHILSI